MKKSSLYTRKGDDGMTSLADGSRVAKNSPRLEAYGTVDELNTQVGLLLAEMETEGKQEDAALLLRIQNLLFEMGAVLAKGKSCAESEEMWTAATTALEEAIDAAEALMGGGWKGFILPSGTRAAAQAHVCRTVCRRAERRILDVEGHDALLLTFMNRLSDYFFVLAKKINYCAHKEEIFFVPSRPK